MTEYKIHKTKSVSHQRNLIIKLNSIFKWEGGNYFFTQRTRPVVIRFIGQCVLSDKYIMRLGLKTVVLN